MTIFNVFEICQRFSCSLSCYRHTPPVSMLFAISALRYRAYEHPPPRPQRPCCSLFRPATPTASILFASLFRPPAIQSLFHSVCFSSPIRLSVRTRRRLSNFLGRFMQWSRKTRTYALRTRGPLPKCIEATSLFCAGRSLDHRMFCAIKSIALNALLYSRCERWVSRNMRPHFKLGPTR
jgi:hypothetical protein